MEPFEATSATDLHRKLRANDIRVPPRGQGRTTNHTETWVTCRFLATIAGTDQLHFPLRVEPGDRPDLVLSLPTGRIGIELIEAVSTDQARVDAMVERDDSSGLRHIPRYRISDPPQSQAEIRALARGEARTLPRMGDSVERDWVDAMLHIIQGKRAAFLKPGFAEYPTNWLLVYEQLAAGFGAGGGGRHGKAQSRAVQTRLEQSVSEDLRPEAPHRVGGRRRTGRHRTSDSGSMASALAQGVSKMTAASPAGGALRVSSRARRRRL